MNMKALWASLRVIVGPWLLPIRRFLSFHTPVARHSQCHRDPSLQETSIVTVGNSGKQGE